MLALRSILVLSLAALARTSPTSRSLPAVDEAEAPSSVVHIAEILEAGVVGHDNVLSKRDGDSDGTLSLPVIHAPRQHDLARREVEVQLENRSDVAYYTQSMCFTAVQQPHGHQCIHV